MSNCRYANELLKYVSNFLHLQKNHTLNRSSKYHLDKEFIEINYQLTLIYHDDFSQIRSNHYVIKIDFQNKYCNLLS